MGVTEDGQIELPIPRNVNELGIPPTMVHDLVLRQTLATGRTSTTQLSRKLALSPVLVSFMVEELRDLRLLEVQGVDGRDYLLALTDAGRQQALDRMQLCRYTGPAPVNLQAYTDVIRAQHAEPHIRLGALRDAFADLVVTDELLREIGPAAIAGGAMFLYGPPGTGKSSIAERLLRIYGDHVMVPFAIEVDGQVITVFDPVVHEPCDEQPKDCDPRWIRCKRPFIIVGGELGPDMLDLQYQSGSGTYGAPVQLQANNGILVIDDFGRQANLTPQQLLNRWIVPLDRQRDYLSLEYGFKFPVPFDAKIVFSTNLEPETLGDEAFFRRIQSKILIPSITDDAFEEVLRRVAATHDVSLTPDAATHLRWMSRELGDGDLRPYLPGAVIKILLSICDFEDLPLELNPTMVERIAHIYFTHADDRDDELPVAATSRARRSMPKPLLDGGSLFTVSGDGGDASHGTGDGARSTGDWTTKALAALRAANGADAMDESAVDAGGAGETGETGEAGDDHENGPSTGLSTEVVAGDGAMPGAVDWTVSATPNG